jgi:hypothetical protein
LNRELSDLVAQRIYKALKAQSPNVNLVMTAPVMGELTMVDGEFDLCVVAASVLDFLDGLQRDT